MELRIELFSWNPFDLTQVLQIQVQFSFMTHFNFSAELFPTKLSSFYFLMILRETISTLLFSSAS